MHGLLLGVRKKKKVSEVCTSWGISRGDCASWGKFKGIYKASHLQFLAAKGWGSP